MMLLDGGLDWKAFSHTSQEAQTIEHRKLNAIEACAVYDMPPTMVQILDHATFSNIDEQHRMLYQDTLGPVVVNLEATIGAQLLWGEPQLGVAVDPEDGEIENTLVAFDMDDVLRADIVKRAAAYRRDARRRRLTSTTFAAPRASRRSTGPRRRRPRPRRRSRSDPNMAGEPRDTRRREDRGTAKGHLRSQGQSESPRWRRRSGRLTKLTLEEK
jgi:phage portal protein BeeE